MLAFVTRFWGLTYSFSTTTEGMRIASRWLRTTSSYSAMMLTRSRNTALIASCHGQSDRGK